ncbi:MAG: ClbS/DfsB family four-helix bundle protein [Cyclobacteriaceae bacterium]
MPRPTSKKELLDLSQRNYDQLINLVKSFSPDTVNSEFPKEYLNRNIRDVIAHLHHWHLMFLKWYTDDAEGRKPDIPAKGYTWKTLPELNREIQEKYSKTDLSEVLDLFNQSWLRVWKIINSHSNEELFTKKKYRWTGTTSLGAYLISATSSHYDWGIKLIKKCKKQNQASL